MNNQTKVALVIVCGLAAMSSASIFVRLALSDGASPIVISAVRLSLAVALFSIPAVLRQSWKECATLTFRSGIMLVASGILLALHFASWITSLSQTSILSSVVLVSSAPVWIGIASPFLLNESPPVLSWIGILIAILGGAILGYHDLTRPDLTVGIGDFLALIGALCAAGYLIIGRHLRSTLSLTSYVWVVYGVASFFLAGWAFISGEPLVGLNAQAYVWLIALSLIPQLVGHTSANYLVRKLPATQVSVFMLGESVGSSSLAILLFREIPQLMQVIGGLTILLGIALSSLAWNQVPSNDTRET